MAVAPTGAIYKALSFDNVSSRTYGVYITGQAVYNAPTRDVEMISIPGRNGAFALDKGRFENIEVSYPAGIFADNETDFAEAISDFRNFLCSRNGYVRLTDEYNPNEYRMAIYKSGLEVTPAQLKAGEFNIVFDCKPQRWLTSGETAVTIGEWGETETASSGIVSVENPNGVLAVKSLEVDLEPIQSGSGTPSPTNVRPISGHTDVVVSRTGKNLCDTSLVYNGYINVSQQKIASNANARTLYLPCKPNTTYTVSKQAGQRFVVAESTVIPTNNVVVSNVISNYTASSITITTSASAKYLVAFVYLSTADTGVTADQMLATCQIELGSRATTYEAYEGDTYTTALGTTVYGGTLDVTTGVLTVTHAIVTYDGTETWDYYSVAQGNLFRHTQSDRESGPLINKEVYCNRFEVVDNTNRTNGTLSSPNSGGEKYFDFIYDDCNSVATWKTWLSSNNVQVVYPLATPTTTTLTAQQISTLLGDNNIWSSGGIITLEYGQNPSVLFNPTLFESSPMLEVEGYGNIDFNGYEIEIENQTIGTFQYPKKSFYLYDGAQTGTFVRVAGELLERTLPGDQMTILSKDSPNSLTMYAVFYHDSALYSGGAASYTISGTNATVFRWGYSNDGSCTLQLSVEPLSFYVETASTKTFTLNWSFTTTDRTTSQSALTEMSATVTINYDGNATFTYTVNYSIDSDPFGAFSLNKAILYSGYITVYSTETALGHPTYIDCDLGEAYMIKSGVPISLNGLIDLGSDLPILSSGANTVTFDNTVTDLKIIPRWWKV